MHAKLYKIVSPSTDQVYYGCTTKKYLCDRMAHHMYVYRNSKTCTSREILKYLDAKIELIEEFEYNTDQEKKEKEAFYIKNNPCVNNQIPGRTPKEWLENNKQKRNQYLKEYRQKKNKLLNEAKHNL
jgi:hypothetical protein